VSFRSEASPQQAESLAAVVRLLQTDLMAQIFTNIGTRRAFRSRQRAILTKRLTKSLRGDHMIAAFETYLNKIEDPSQQARVREVLNWVQTAFPQLEQRFAWNQPMFTDHGTFIIGFSVAKAHMAFAPEGAAMTEFADQIAADNYNSGKKFGRIKWTQPVDYDLLKRIIAFNLADKADCTTFWRK